MAKVMKGIIQTKTKPKAAAKTKTLSKTTAAAPAAKTQKRLSGEPVKHKMMSVAAVSALAASAATSIIKSKELSASSKVKKLEIVVDLLETAKQRRLSKAGEWLLTRIHEPAGKCDMRAVMR